MPEPVDTPTILAALDVALIHLRNVCVDPRCRIHQAEHDAIDPLRTLRSQIEKEAEFVEAAKRYCNVSSRPPWNDQAAPDEWFPMFAAWNAISEKPPEVWTQEELDRAAKRAEKWKPLLSLPSSPPARGREKPPEEGAK